MKKVAVTAELFRPGRGLSSMSQKSNASDECFTTTVVNRWDEKAGLRRDAIRSQVIDALEAQEIKETGLLIPSDYNNNRDSIEFLLEKGVKGTARPL
jgi:hypothetical protein